MTALCISIPFLLHQLWAFISPGLYRHERKLAIPLLLTSVLLFALGVAFAYGVVLPLVFAFFTQTGPQGVAIMTDINHYLDFVLKMFVAFGIAFEVPVALVLMVASGIVSVATLQRGRPYVVVICFVIGMLLTPPDVISQLLLAIPMWLLFELGLLCVRLWPPKR